MSSLSNFAESGNCFVRLLTAVPSSGWDQEVLRDWSVRSLAGHTARAILTVETYLSHDEPDRVSIPDAETYYSSVYPRLFDLSHIREDALSAGRWLGADPAGSAADAFARTCSIIDAQPAGRIVSIGGMGIPLAEYLRTRVVELVLHTMDLSEATGIPHRLPDAAITDASRLAEAIPAALRHGEERLVDAVGVL